MWNFRVLANTALALATVAVLAAVIVSLRVGWSGPHSSSRLLEAANTLLLFSIACLLHQYSRDRKP